MIWGYHHLRKHPCGDSSVSVILTAWTQLFFLAWHLASTDLFIGLSWTYFQVFHSKCIVLVHIIHFLIFFPHISGLPQVIMASKCHLKQSIIVHPSADPPNQPAGDPRTVPSPSATERPSWMGLGAPSRKSMGTLHVNQHTVDGSEIRNSPVEGKVVEIPLFIGFGIPSQVVVWDFVHQQ